MDESLLQYSYTSLDDLEGWFGALPLWAGGRKRGIPAPASSSSETFCAPTWIASRKSSPTRARSAGDCRAQDASRSPRSLKASAALLSASLESRLAEDELARFWAWPESPAPLRPSRRPDAPQPRATNMTTRPGAITKKDDVMVKRCVSDAVRTRTRQDVYNGRNKATPPLTVQPWTARTGQGPNCITR